MRALRIRARRRRHDRLSPPFSNMLSGIIIAISLLWVLFFIYGVTALSCAQLVALSLQGAPGLPGAAVLFIAAFAALALLWLIDVARSRTAGPGVVRRVAEGLLIAAGLYTALVHYAFLRPETQAGRAVMAVYEGPGRIMFAGHEHALIELTLADDHFGMTPAQAAARDRYVLGPLDPSWYPFQGAGVRCSCFTRRDESLAHEHRLIDWYHREGIGDPAQLAQWRESLDPRPQTPDWCVAALAPVSYPE
jgi:hypothetical protein